MALMDSSQIICFFSSFCCIQLMYIYIVPNKQPEDTQVLYDILKAFLILNVLHFISPVSFLFDIQIWTTNSFCF